MRLRVATNRGARAAPESPLRVFRACGRVVLMEIRPDGTAGEEWHIPQDEATPEYLADRLDQIERYVKQKQRPHLSLLR